MEIPMDAIEPVTCPNCKSGQALVVYRLHSGITAHYCPDCEYAWDVARKPVATSSP